jgi:hypothetical protein
MSDKQRIQINVNLSPGQKGQLDALALHYGSTSAAVRVALDALWREFVRNQAAVSGSPQTFDEDEQPSGAGVVAGAIANANCRSR